MYVQVPHIALLLLVLMAWPSLCQAKDYPPLVLFYEKETASYKSIDLETIDDYGLDHQAENRVVITCPAKPKFMRAVQYDVLEIDTKKNNYKNQCDYSYKPSMIENNKRAGYTVGFYFIEDNLEIFYERVLQQFSKILDNTNGKPRMDIYEIETNHATFEVKETRHRIVSIRRFLFAIPKPCKKLTGMVQVELGRGLTEDIKSYYSPEKQQQLLKEYGFDNDFFIPGQLVPIDDFTDNASRQATCTYFNTVPIWRSVAEIVRQMGIFIRRLADVFKDGALKVVTRTFEILELSSTTNTGSKKWYLNFNKEKIPVPRFFVKIIHYQFGSPEVNDDDSNKNDYYMIVGVYNISMEVSKPYPTLKHCNYDICLRYRWNVDIPFQENSRIFCCDIKDPSALEELGLDKFSGNILDLNRIPIGKNEKGEIIWSQLPIFR